VRLKIDFGIIWIAARIFDNMNSFIYPLLQIRQGLAFFVGNTFGGFSIRIRKDEDSVLVLTGKSYFEVVTLLG